MKIVFLSLTLMTLFTTISYANSRQVVVALNSEEPTHQVKQSKPIKQKKKKYVWLEPDIIQKNSDY
ncbi:hypothetical protein CRYPA_430 [uncultured Candidatus Thioglobus sp.]|nr:hypothetical protein CRYPA_430 [uncultured Candidatus Thioglobus sp.]